MKAKHILIALLSLSATVFAQDRTTVTATTNDISDNLDLRAVASIFGDSRDLEDFERRLNDPKKQISNLDLNRDNQVDYLRVIESVEGNTHLIIIQSVLDRDVFQDVATVEVEKDRNNNVQVQVVGDVFMYGSNYIYEPVYVYRPAIYNHFWVHSYSPYFSSWYWNYYPSYYYAWQPYPIFYYQNYIGGCINNSHHYNYVNRRRSERAMAMHNGRRSNGYETRHPERSFAKRNATLTNAYGIRNQQGSTPVRTSSSLTSGTRTSAPAVTPKAVRTVRTDSDVRSSYNATTTPRPQVSTPVRTATPRLQQSSPRVQQSSPRVQAPQRYSANQSSIRESASPRVNFNTRTIEPRQSQRDMSDNNASSPTVRFGGRR